MTNHSTRCAVAAAMLLAAACSDRKSSDLSTAKAMTDSAAAKAHADSVAMAAMPGMAMPAGSGADVTADKPSVTALTEQAITFTAAQIAHGKVQWAKVAGGFAGGSATLPGQIITNEDRTVRLDAPARGRILAVAVSPGDRVSRGQTLVTIESPEAGMAQSDLAKATAAVSSSRAQAQYAKAARDRAERLLELKAIPRQDYERAVADDELAQSSLQQAEAEARRARSTATQLGADNSSSGRITLRAPLDGVVLSRAAVPGTVIEAGAPLVGITDPSTVWIVVNAPEEFAPLFRTGGQLRFTVPAMPRDTFVARITSVGAGLDPSTRTLPVRALAGSGNGRLKPSMFATVTVDGGPQSAAVMVPEDAVQLLDGKPTVFIAQPDGKGGVRLTRREVEIGSRADGRVAVLRGLRADEVIVVAGAFGVKAEFQKTTMPKMDM